jgi:hypothetical protein
VAGADWGASQPARPGGHSDHLQSVSGGVSALGGSRRESEEGEAGEEEEEGEDEGQDKMDAAGELDTILC